MFWKFDLHPSTAIDSILAKEDCTLNEILDEDDVIQETKSQNRKLVDFFVRPEILEELVDLIISEPDEEIDEKLRYKHSNVACEVLTADVYTIIDKLASSEDLLNKLWSFLEADPPLNPLLASFFSKVIGVLISRKTSLMIDYLKTKEDFVSLLTKHMGTSAIMDLLLRFITSVESPQLRCDLMEWLSEQKLIESLVSLIDPEIDEDRNSNAAQTLSDIIRLSRDHQSQMQESASQDILLETIQKRETISSLLDHMLHGIHTHNDSALVNGIFVLLTLLEVKKGPGEGEEPMTALDAERLAQGVSATLAALTPRLQDFHDLLTDPPLMNAMPTTVGTLDPPLGNSRLQIAKLISSILATNGDTINKELASQGTIKVLWDLFFKYSWNNFLHTQVERCIYTLLNNPPTEEDGELHTPLIDTLFKECKCIQKILENWEDSDPEITQSQARHRGYMGHLSNIANYVVYAREKGKNKDVIESVLNEIPEKDREKWNSFVSGTLAEINKTNSSDLVGHHPLQSSSDDDDDYKPVPFLHSENSLQQVFSNYQMQQMTTVFVDTFGSDEDNFQEPDDSLTSQFNKIGDISFNINANEENPNSALFEACCNERIQQFDDSGSDEEDVWEEKELKFSSVIENRKSMLSDSDSESSGSEEEEEEGEGRQSPQQQSTGSSGSDDDRIVFSDDVKTPPESPAKKPPWSDNKMDVDTANTWSDFNNSSEVAMDESVSIDAADVGWDKAGNTVSDTGWANFDNFTDIGMAASTTEQTEKRPDSPVAMETETSPSPPENPSASPASAYEVDEQKQDTESKEKESVDLSKGLVLDSSSVFNSSAEEDTTSSSSTNQPNPPVTAPLPPRAASYSCDKGEGAPLASNDSDDDISDDDDDLPDSDNKPSIVPENLKLQAEPFGNALVKTPHMTSADNSTASCDNSREEPIATNPSSTNATPANDQSEAPKDNGPVDFDDDQTKHQSNSKAAKHEDSRLPIPSPSETPPLANGPG